MVTLAKIHGKGGKMRKKTKLKRERIKYSGEIKIYI